jgi:NADPH:quinone reductase-like Zn-dependent oxidoreductase
MPELPLKQKAIIGLEDGTLGVSDDVDIPSLKEDMLLVKNRAVACNPSDTKFVGKLGCPGAIAGMDFAGEVVAVGSKYHKATGIKVGDRVSGAVLGMDPDRPTVGAFAEFVGAADTVTLKIPENWSFEQAACLGGSGPSTIGLALFKSLKVPGTPNCPAEKPVDVLVYGGSSATGTLAIQLLKL